VSETVAWTPPAPPRHEPCIAVAEAERSDVPRTHLDDSTPAPPPSDDCDAPTAGCGSSSLERELVEAGNAERFARIHGAEVRFVAKWGAWLAWRRGRWQRDDNNVLVTERAKDVGRQLLVEASAANDSAMRSRLIAWAKASLSARGIRALLELSRSIGDIPIEHEALDADPWLLGVRNGVIDLRTGTLRAPRPDDLMTMQAPVKFDGAATAPRWSRALEEWFPDEETRAYLRRIAGAALVGAQRDHVFVIHYGTGRNGKGTFVRALMKALGEYAVTPHLSLIVQQRHAEHDTVKATLFRARLAVASETEKKVSLAESSIKNLTGGDRIKCRRMHENEWEFDPSHSLWLLTNHLPTIGGRDTGVWSRIRVVPWVANFEAAPDGGLGDALAEELPGILRWAVEGCLEWRDKGLVEPESVKRATLDYRSTQDVCSRFADDSGIAFGRDLHISVRDLNELLDEWMRTEKIQKSPDLSEWLKENGANQLRDRDASGKQFRLWRGVGLTVTPVTSESGFSLNNTFTKEKAESPSHKSQVGDVLDRGEAWEPDESQVAGLESEANS
jgi:putative DNA primase/helicase